MFEDRKLFEDHLKRILVITLEDTTDGYFPLETIYEEPEEEDEEESDSWSFHSSLESMESIDESQYERLLELLNQSQENIDESTLLESQIAEGWEETSLPQDVDEENLSDASSDSSNLMELLSAPLHTNTLRNCLELLGYIALTNIIRVPYDEIDTDSALVQMFTHVNAPTCKYIVAVGALAGLTVSMFGSMFPMPRVVYAMAQDGLIFRKLSTVSPTTGTPANATVCGGISASLVALVIQLEVLVEMMSIGTLLAYTLVSTCVLVLRYQPHSTNLIDLLPQSLRTPVDPEGTANANRETTFTARGQTHIMPPSQRIMVRRVTRSSPDSDDTLPGDDSEEFGRDDSFLVNPTTENQFYVGGGSSGTTTACGRFFSALRRQLLAMSYLFPGLCPWVDLGPATEHSGIYVIKAVGVMYVLIIVFDLFAAYGNPYECTVTTVIMLGLLIAIITLLLLISRRPQSGVTLMYTTPGLPFFPAIAITVNIYLILNLSILTLVRFMVWMSLGLVMYFKYGIKNSTLETNPPVPPAPTPPPPNPLDRTTIPPPSPHQSRPTGDRNIFEGDGNNGLYGNMEYSDPLLAWHESDLNQPSTRATGSKPTPSYRQFEARFDPKTNSTSLHTYSVSRPPWADPDATYDKWDSD